MRSFRGVGFVLLCCVGCLDPLVSDEPGYSKLVLPEGTVVPSADEDVALDARIDMYDGVDAPSVELHAGLADGKVVHYWDLGATSVRPVPGFRFVRCGADGKPTDGAVDHPLLFDSLPGDRDYGALRALQPVCLTAEYDGELITSLEALDDAIDIGIASEPGEAATWLNCPVVAKGVSLETAADVLSPPRDVYYRGKRVHCLDLSAQEGEFSTAERPLVGNVYELRRKGDAENVRVVFPGSPTSEAGERASDYTPLRKIVKVTLDSSENLDDYRKESDFAVLDGMALVPAHAGVLSVTPTTTIANRPLRFVGAP